MCKFYLLFSLCLLFCCMLTGCQDRPGTSKTIHVEATASDQRSESDINAKPIKVNIAGTEVTVPNGYNAIISIADAKQPVPSDAPAKTSSSKEKSESDSGNGGGDDEPAGFDGSLWIGIVICIAGLFIFLSKRAGPTSKFMSGSFGFAFQAAAIAPRGFGIGLMLLGGAVIILPWLLDTVSPIVYDAAYIAAGIALVWWVWNIFQHERKQEQQSKNPFDEEETQIIERLSKNDLA